MACENELLLHLKAERPIGDAVFVHITLAEDLLIFVGFVLERYRSDDAVLITIPVEFRVVGQNAAIGSLVLLLILIADPEA